jgi:hypothetical protein
MTRLLATVTALKAIPITAGVSLARGNTLPVVLISTLLTFVQIAARPQTAARAFSQRAAVVASSHDRTRSGGADRAQTIL